MLERRSLTSEIQVVEEAGARWIVGRAAPFNQETLLWEMDGRRQYEVIRPGSFRRTLGSGRDVVAVLNHDDNQLLGRRSSGTLELEETDGGLDYRILLNEDDPMALGVYHRTRRRDLKGSSFQFDVPGGGEQFEARDDGVLRIITEARLYDVGPVTYPAYKGTDVQARSAGLAFRNAPPEWREHDPGADGSGDADGSADGDEGQNDGGPRPVSHSPMGLVRCRQQLAEIQIRILGGIER